MNPIKSSEYYQLLALIAVFVLAVPLLATHMTRSYEGKISLYMRPLNWIENLMFKAIGSDRKDEMTWREYAGALLLFNFVGFMVLFLLQLVQNLLPLNQGNLPAVAPLLAFNTAVSFVTNTNWQAYSGEATLTHLTQMLGIGVQNFLSAATGMAVAVALARSIIRDQTRFIGSFWVDVVRSIVYILMPLSVLMALALVSQGVVQNFSSDLTILTLSGDPQVIPMGPAASQVAIKQLGTNGGGFFGVNSAHPFENPTALSNFIQTVSIFLIPVAFPLVFGRLTGNKKHGVMLLATMTFLFTVMFCMGVVFETTLNPQMGNLGALEGKEVRFGILSSVLWTVATTATSNGSVNAMISSMSPLTGGIAMLNIMLGEVIFGGVGSGLYGMVLFSLLTVFIAGLMIGRSPEYLGKKIESTEIKFAALAIIAPCALILVGSALAVSSNVGLSNLSSGGPHGLSEVLYAFSSAVGNNGSAFGGLNGNTAFYNSALGMAMILGRFVVILPTLAIAGSFARKKKIPVSQGTFPVDGGLFVALLMAVILIVGALTFLPVLSLGPIVEHLLMLSGRTF